MDFSALSFERHLIHQRLHEVDAATMRALEIFVRHRIGNRTWIKPLSFVRNDKRDSLSQLTSTENMNNLARIHPVAVDDCVVQSFLKCQLNFRFFARNAMRSFD